MFATVVIVLFIIGVVLAVARLAMLGASPKGSHKGRRGSWWGDSGSGSGGYGCSGGSSCSSSSSCGGGGGGGCGGGGS
ncbi:hypothetical protein LG634_01325 [Streptomyces bambusae]|uniref:hypothetical protein n=1 Tax=Streptomyces bambusae TaxID=1550616 RepID=UPI001CFF45A3|nr:hypothetical protein [Streptomyces bambusae]MCB5163492.1 hypothetical protein [Streptomyces bambusae]